MISSNAPPDKVRVPTQVSDLVSQGGSSGHWADTNPPWGGNSSQEVVTVPRGVERGSDTTSSWPLAHGGQAVGSTAEAQVRGGAVGGVLASGSTAIPVAVGLHREGKRGECLPSDAWLRANPSNSRCTQRSYADLQTELPSQTPAPAQRACMFLKHSMFYVHHML